MGLTQDGGNRQSDGIVSGVINSHPYKIRYGVILAFFTFGSIFFHIYSTFVLQEEPGGLAGLTAGLFAAMAFIFLVFGILMYLFVLSLKIILN